MPDGAATIWDAFAELAASRRYSSSGIPFAIPPSEILALATLRRVTFEPWELDALQKLDGAYLSSFAKRGDAE